jgi:hypothetical protein
MPRPSKFAPELARRAVALAAAGSSHRTIAREIGLGRRTLADWLARGRSGGEPFAAFAVAFDQAGADAQRARAEARAARRKAEGKARWQAFKADRQCWWKARVGDPEFWSRRLEWLLDRGKTAAFDRTVARLESEGYRVKTTP